MKLDICNKYFYNNKKCFINCYFINDTINCKNLYYFINRCFNSSCLTIFESRDIIINNNCTDFNICNDTYIFRIMTMILICISMSICLFYYMYYFYKTI